MEDILGKWQYHGWIRHEGPPICPENVEPAWKFWDPVVGYSESTNITIKAAVDNLKE